MKKIILFLFTMAFVIPTMSFAQQNSPPPETITVKTSDLTTDQLVKIKTEQAQALLETKLKTYGSWVGVGGEIGTAIKDGLNAVVDVSDKFGKTDVGKFTLIMIAYKVMGRDFIRIVIGIFFFIVFVIVLLFLFHNKFNSHRICIKDNGWKFWLPKEYEILSPKISSDYVWLVIVAFFLGLGTSTAIMFG